MTASYNISFLGSPEQAESRASKKGYRSSKYNNYMVEVVDFDNESHTFEVDARSEAEASEQAADMAMAAGLQVSYCNVYLVGVPMKKSEMEFVKSSLKEIVNFDG